jgi:hypothetical protein
MKRALKWIVWIPRGLLHAPRIGKNRTRQDTELVRTFVMIRLRGMVGLRKMCKQVAVMAQTGYRRKMREEEMETMRAYHGQLG